MPGGKGKSARPMPDKSDKWVEKPHLFAALNDMSDAASRRMCTWYWSTIAAPGQSWLEVGRERIRNLPDGTSYHSNWHVAERHGQTVGALFGFSIPEPFDRVDLTQMEPQLRPMIELEMIAQGSWLLQAISLFQEHRGKGLGPILIDKACGAARTAGASAHRIAG
jgi:GNAT superfamily N-acetyltransferase